MIKSIVKLTKQVAASLAVQLRHGTENSFVMGEADKVGLIPVLEWKLAIESLYLELNFTSLINEVSI